MYVLHVFQITNLKRIRTDPNYQELRELHAENNHIVSMHEIEASNFIKNFQVLDIRANRLTEVRLKFFNYLILLLLISSSYFLAYFPHFIKKDSL